MRSADRKPRPVFARRCLHKITPKALENAGLTLPSQCHLGAADAIARPRLQEPVPSITCAGSRLGIARRRLAPGGARRVRTDDLMLAKHALYQLSYGPIGASEGRWWAQADSNRRPHAYQACALTN